MDAIRDGMRKCANPEKISKDRNWIHDGVKSCANPENIYKGRNRIRDGMRSCANPENDKALQKLRNQRSFPTVEKVVY